VPPTIPTLIMCNSEWNKGELWQEKSHPQVAFSRQAN